MTSEKIKYVCLWAGMLMLLSCTQTVVTTEGGHGADIPIFFDTYTDGYPQTRALVQSDNFDTQGNTLRVYDLWTNDGAGELYMNGVELVHDGANWVYNPLRYWTKTGSHSFTAYLESYSFDGAVRSLPQSTSGGPLVTYDSETITVGEWKIGPDSQFDFLYGRATRSMTEVNPTRPVEMGMQHLLSAVEFRVTNLIFQNSTTATNIYLTGLEISGLYDTGTATVSKSGAVSLSLSGPGDAVGVSYDNASRKALLYGVAHNAFAGVGDIGSDGCYLIWPHSQDLLGDVKATISYVNGSSTQTREISLKSNSVPQWIAGYKYIYNIEIRDNSITFSVSVVDWVTDDVILED